MKLRTLLPIILVAILVTAIGSAGAASGPVLGKAKPSPKPSPTPTGSPSPSPSPTGTPPPTGFASEQAWGTGDSWEPSIAVDPRAGSQIVYQATTRYGGTKACQRCPSPMIMWRKSIDGGTTWGADQYICTCTGVRDQADPEFEVANDGTIYASWMNGYTPGVMFSKSTNGGSTWTTPIALGGSLQWTDKPILAISPSGQDVYVAFNKTDSYIVASHNGGASFSAPVKTNSDSLYWFAEGGAVAPNGNVYFSLSGEVATPSAAGDVQLAVARSTNGGTSWTHTIIDTSKQFPVATGGAAADFFASQATLAIDGAGKIVVAYTLNTTAGAPKSLYVKTSTDGTTWTARSLVNSLGDSGFPSLVAGPANGDFRLAWQDNRSGGYNTFYRRSTNGGTSWGTEVKLSNLTSGAAYKSASGYGFPYGDYFEIETNAAGTTYAIWGEGPSYAGPGGSWFTKGQ